MSRYIDRQPAVKIVRVDTPELVKLQSTMDELVVRFSKSQDTQKKNKVVQWIKQLVSK